MSTPEGLLAVGGNLSPDRLLDAYRHGIFPWPISDEEPLYWWSPHPRAIMPLDGFIASRRLLRRIRSGKFSGSINQAFRDVMEGCRSGPGREGGTWITDQMVSGYCRLHQLGHAHSVEVWCESQLVGGVYGVAIGGLFSAESMFYRFRDASKVALYYLVNHLNHRGYQLLDVQQWTPHTGRLGAIEIPRHEYLMRLDEAVKMPVTFGSVLRSS